jgi:hypothetical protein
MSAVINSQASIEGNFRSRSLLFPADPPRLTCGLIPTLDRT